MKKKLEVPFVQPPLTDIPTAARILSVSTWTVRALIKSGRLPKAQLGRKVVIPMSTLQKFAEQITKDATA